MSAAPTFRFEENRLVHALRVMAYPGDTFTSEEACRCAFAVTAARKGDKTPPAHETNLAEWSRVLDVLLSAEPKTWIEGGWTKDATDARIAEAERQEKQEKEEGRSTQL
jgi:hypothetical protein